MPVCILAEFPPVIMLTCIVLVEKERDESRSGSGAQPSADLITVNV